MREVVDEKKNIITLTKLSYSSMILLKKFKVNYKGLEFYTLFKKRIDSDVTCPRNCPV